MDGESRQLGRLVRRTVLAGGAAAGLGWLAGGERLAAAQDDAEPVDDLGLLAFLLTLEQTEVALLDEGLERFDDAEWEAALGLASARLDLETIRDQDGAHVAALSDAITEAGGTPPDPVAYDFGYEDAPGFVRVATAVAETVAAGYAGVVPLLQDPAAQATAIGILVVEGRHAAYLKLRAGESPFPSPIDQPLSRDEALANLAGYAEGQIGPEQEPEPEPEPQPEPPPEPEPEVAPAPEQPPAAEPTLAPTGDADDAADDAPAADADRNVFAAVIADAAAVLGVDAAAVELVEVTETEWPDASLGCPDPGAMYAQVITPGFRVILQAAGETLEYHTDKAGNFVRCV